MMVSSSQEAASKFVDAWQRADSVDQVVASLERLTGEPQDRKAVQARASYYRKRGVQLQKFPVGRQALDVGELNRVAELASAPAR